MVPLSFVEIANRLKSANLPETDLVIGIGTGGIVPASLAAFHLNAELRIITLNYRDEKNTPRYDEPVVLNLPPDMELEGKRILLVDDVSVSGKTLNAALDLLKGYQVTTLTMKGKAADIILFPEVKDCVKWPWKEQA
jgi:hypoxanthine phosphoribosyltransferase